MVQAARSHRAPPINKPVNYIKIKLAALLTRDTLLVLVCIKKKSSINHTDLFTLESLDFMSPSLRALAFCVSLFLIALLLTKRSAACRREGRGTFIQNTASKGQVETAINKSLNSDYFLMLNWFKKNNFIESVRVHNFNLTLSPFSPSGPGSPSLPSTPCKSEKKKKTIIHF